MSDFSDRQFRLMLDRINAFEAGQIDLGKVVDDLEGLLNAAVVADNDWKSRFLSEWGKLEDVRAFALCEGQKELDPETGRLVRTASTQLRNLVLEKFDDQGIS